jgi:hypothetical protein
MMRAVLVELDPILARRAAKATSDGGLSSVEVRCADAGELSSFSDVLPVDILMLCGIFGNVEHPTVRHIVQAIPAMVASGGYVIWTRGGDPTVDHRREVRSWFGESGMPEVSFDGQPETYGVGVNRVTAHATSLLSGRLFTFRTAHSQ